jgi:hypothetical protein
MLAEQSGAARQTVGETMVNRANAWGTSLTSIVNNRKYYQPYQNGAFNQRMRQIERDPKLYQEILAQQDAILAGSDRSKLATHNASAGVARRARLDQSVAVEEAGETYTRKDVNPKRHGAGIVAKERAWHQRTQTEIAQAERVGGGTQVAELQSTLETKKRDDAAGASGETLQSARSETTGSGTGQSLKSARAEIDKSSSARRKPKVRSKIKSEVTVTAAGDTTAKTTSDGDLKGNAITRIKAARAKAKAASSEAEAA